MALLKGGQSQLLGVKAQEDAGDGKPVSRLAGLLAKGLMKQENTILKDEKGVIIDQGDGQKKISFFSRKKQEENNPLRRLRILNGIVKEKTLLQKLIIYPEDRFRAIWDLCISLILICTCIITPYNLAFQKENQQRTWIIIDSIMNLFFIIDIIVNFLSAFYTSDFEMINTHKKIAKNYLLSWFAVDLISVVPIDFILLSSGSYNKIARLARIGKLYQLVRMTKVVRLLKVIQQRNKLGKHMNEVLKISLGFERYIFMLIIYLVLQHIIACLWIFTARFADDAKETWIYKSKLIDSDDFTLYISAFYFTVTTVVTVGYGDITAVNAGEKAICILLMLIGVIAFSFGTGALSSIIANYDTSQARVKEKMSVLQQIKSEYKLSNDLYSRLIKSITYDFSKTTKDIFHFMEELPYKLKIELAMEIHKSLYETVSFFKGKDKTFIAWVGNTLRPINSADNEIIYKEDDDITEIYFLIHGVAGYVIPRLDNQVFIKIEEGDHFGHTDIVYDQSFIEYQMSTKKRVLRNRDIIRSFTVLSIIQCELLILTIDDLEKMKVEFPDVFIDLFINAYERLNYQCTLRNEAIAQYDSFMRTRQNTEMLDEGASLETHLNLDPKECAAEFYTHNMEFQKDQNKLVRDYLMSCPTIPKFVKRMHAKLPQSSLITYFSLNLKTVKQINQEVQNRMMHRMPVIEEDLVQGQIKRNQYILHSPTSQELVRHQTAGTSQHNDDHPAKINRQNSNLNRRRTTQYGNFAGGFGSLIRSNNTIKIEDQHYGEANGALLHSNSPIGTPKILNNSDEIKERLGRLETRFDRLESLLTKIYEKIN
ncbi:hypothetical protein FGO68_gene1058 [Halteria grandinella]|uniref:Cyclic nucleotide-binding domain-containing protein n=1 Tax=Halteria grandinella TaxID=5974 RepID=A0A8J8P6H1_HALGN|nr:hypothetical protein FGO68_gene1058 [Halteria grandinella]